MNRRAAIAGSSAIAIAIGLGLISLAPASYVYSLEAEFGSAPGDDVPLVEWLKSQSGVVPHTVDVQRTAMRPPKLVVSFIMQRNAWGRPRLPALADQARAFGYSLATPDFNDTRRTESLGGRELE